jgi:preprotein translocase subunit SecA
MNMQREVIYDRRRNALFGERIKLDLDHALFDFCDKLVEKYFPTYDIESLELECIRRLGIAPEFTAKDLDRLGAKGVVEKIYTQAKTNYHKKEVRIAQHLFEAVSAAKASHPEVMVVEASMTDGVREVPLYLPVFKVIETEGRIMINEYEKNVVLNVIDDKWKTHLRDMDDLKQSVQNAVYEQKDPLIIYKFSAFELFQKMIEDVNAEIISMLHRGEVAAQHEIDTPIIEPKRDDFSKLAAYHNDTPPQAKNQSKPVTVQRQMPTLHDAAEPAATTEAAGVPNRTERRAKQKESFADKIKRQQLEKAKAKNTKK